MKRFNTIVLCLLAIMLSKYGMAQFVEQKTVEKAALTWLKKAENKQIKDYQTITDANKLIIAYQFNLWPRGYLVLTANRSLPPVLAYSFTNNFEWKTERFNPLFDILKYDLENRLSNIDKNTKTSIENNKLQWESLLSGISEFKRFEQWPPSGSTSTGGWLETNWSQQAPYNSFCPLDEITTNRSLAGCPAVALAMIIHYQKTLNGTHFNEADDYYHSYAGRQYWIDDDAHEMDFPAFPELNEYFDSIEIKFPAFIPLNMDEIEALVFACGVAAHQVYSSEASGTFGVDQAYDAYLRFGFQDASLIYETDTGFYTQMKHNIMLGKPVHLAVLSNTGQGGHNLVADGYNTDDYYHLNFGWGGNYNAWYLIPDEIPYNLTIIEGAIMDIGETHVGFNEQHSANDAELMVYPNPGSDVMHLRYSISEIQYLKFELFSFEGIKIQTLLEKRQAEGEYEIHFDVKDLPAGLYFIKMQMGGLQKTQKIIVLNE